MLGTVKTLSYIKDLTIYRFWWLGGEHPLVNFFKPVCPFSQSPPRLAVKLKLPLLSKPRSWQEVSCVIRFLLGSAHCQQEWLQTLLVEGGLEKNACLLAFSFCSYTYFWFNFQKQKRGEDSYVSICAKREQLGERWSEHHICEQIPGMCDLGNYLKGHGKMWS